METAVGLAGLRDGAEILEVGCGTGEATHAFATLGFDILATDRSAEMLRIAALRLRAFPNVRLENRDFELDPPDRRFGALLLATAYHWLDPSHRVQRTADRLLPGGALILLWHTHPRPYRGFFERVQPIYQRHMTRWSPPPSPGMSADKVGAVAQELASSTSYECVERRSHAWSRSYPRQLYMELLKTYSDHRQLPAEVLARLLDEIGAVIDDEYDGVVERPYRTELIVAYRTRDGD